MEDAMIINKMALDRGFAHGSIFKTELIETKVFNFICIYILKLIKIFYLAAYLLYSRPI